MNDYLSKRKVNAWADMNLKTKSLTERGKGYDDCLCDLKSHMSDKSFDPDPIILGDGSEGRLGDKVMSMFDDESKFKIIATHKNIVWMLSTWGVYSSDNCRNLKALPEPDTWEILEAEADAYGGDDMIGMLRRAKALAGVTG
jgi:hypothetical protein